MIARLLGACVMAVFVWAGAAAGAIAGAEQTVAAAAKVSSGNKVLVLLRLPPGHFRAQSGYGGGYDDKLGHGARLRIAKQLAKDQGLTLLLDWPMTLLGVDCFVMAAPSGQSAQDAVERLSQDKRVSWAQPMNQYTAQAAYSDPLFPAQPAAQLWRLSDLHEIATGTQVRVAVIDSMVDAAHPDLVRQVELKRNFAPEHGDAPEAHGTGVAGVIVARANGLGIVGIAPGARLLALRACWETPTPSARSATTVCDTLSLARALDFAIKAKAEIINLSLSGPPDILLGRLLDVATQRGIIVVAAFDGARADGGFPASHRGVVAATDDWTKVSVRARVYSAPGQTVPTTQTGGRWYVVNGSSFAAAHVSGLLALSKDHASRRPLRRTQVVLARDRTGATDPCATLRDALDPCGCNCPTVAVSALSVTGNR